MLLSFCLVLAQPAKKSSKDAWELKWSDEFDYEGSPDPEKWAVIHRDNRQAHRDLAVVKDSCLQLFIKKIEGKWRAGAFLTAPSVFGNREQDGHDRKMIAPSENGKCRLEIKFRDLNAKGGDPMRAGPHTDM